MVTAMVRLCLRGLGFILCVLAGTFPAAAADIATVGSMSPSLSAGGVQLRAGAGIAENTRLTTSGSGRGEIVFVDGTKLALGPSTSLTVTSSLMRGSNRFRKLGLRTSRGAIRWISGSSGGPAYSLFALNTTIGIRGTVLDITVRGGATYVALISGGARVCGAGGCQQLSRSCDYVEVRNRVSKTKPIAQGFKSRNAAASVFPFIANPSRLSSRFRVGGSGCLNRAAFGRGAASQPADVPQLQAPAPPPAAGGKKCGGNCGKGKGGGGGNGTNDEGGGNDL